VCGASGNGTHRSRQASDFPSLSRFELCPIAQSIHRALSGRGRQRPLETSNLVKIDTCNATLNLLNTRRDKLTWSGEVA
jgi:hypothetical protein